MAKKVTRAVRTHGRKPLAALTRLCASTSGVATFIRVPLKPGTCRWCGCTDHAACEAGCWWVDRRQTLCSECEEFDQAIRTRIGRQAAVAAFKEVGKFLKAFPGVRRR
jgi:hypothetical protein